MQGVAEKRGRFGDRFSAFAKTFLDIAGLIYIVHCVSDIICRKDATISFRI